MPSPTMEIRSQIGVAEETKKAFEAEKCAANEAAFRDSVLKSWRAIEEREPFATIRGDYDLGGADSRHWKTRFFSTT